MELSTPQGQPQRTLDSVEIFQAIDLELDDKIGELAEVGELLGREEIDIKGALSVDIHADWGILALAFADDDVDRARDLLTNAQDDAGQPVASRSTRSMAGRSAGARSTMRSGARSAGATTDRPLAAD